MKKIVVSLFPAPVNAFVPLAGLLILLGLLGYCLLDKPRAVADLIEASLPASDAVMRWILVP